MKPLLFLLLATVLAGAFSDVQAQSSTSATARDASGYVLQTNDLLKITIFQEDDLTTDSRISKTGYVTLPLIGSVRLAGRNVEGATQEVERLFKDGYLRHPKVTITIMEYGKQWVTVLGQVQKPGQVEIPAEGGLDLLGAIAMAGGYTRIANPGRVTVRRNNGGTDSVIEVNAKELARNKDAKTFYVQPGDAITVSESMF